MKKLLLLLMLTLALSGCEISDQYDEIEDIIQDKVEEEVIEIIELVTQEKFDKDIQVLLNEQTPFGETNQEKIVYIEWQVKYDKYFTTAKYWAWSYCNIEGCISITEEEYNEYYEEIQNE